ncbi:unnamed protein product [Tenebrio molitor]|nr:unnamed protein product [Tenebrio molitor]
MTMFLAYDATLHSTSLIKKKKQKFDSPTPFCHFGATDKLIVFIEKMRRIQRHQNY